MWNSFKSCAPESAHLLLLLLSSSHVGPRTRLIGRSPRAAVQWSPVAPDWHRRSAQSQICLLPASPQCVTASQRMDLDHKQVFSRQQSLSSIALLLLSEQQHQCLSLLNIHVLFFFDVPQLWFCAFWRVYGLYPLLFTILKGRSRVGSG